MEYVSEMISIMIMAFALGMDAFSVSLGIGMNQLRRKQIFQMGLLVGFFHIWMPLLGMFLGEVLIKKIGFIAAVGSGFILLALGFHMLYTTLFGEKEHAARPVGIGLLLFAFGVSIDSFSVGVSFGVMGLKVVLTTLIFGFFAMVLTWVGLLIGNKFHQVLDVYSKVIGSVILIAFGLKIIFF